MNLNELPYAAPTYGVEETHALAASFAKLTEPGQVIWLQGEMGSGKTQFVRGFCAGLGMADLWEVDSPTYTLVNRYNVGPGVDHIDLYRFSDPAELEEIGFEDMLASPAIKVIEWPERLRGYPVRIPNFLVRLSIQGTSHRLIRITVPTNEPFP